MPIPELKGLLTDIGVEELGHLEMIGTIVHQLTRNLTEKQIEESGFAPYFVDHTTGVYPTAASGFPMECGIHSMHRRPDSRLKREPCCGAKARITYDNILRLVDDPDVIEPSKFPREREIVHFQRFGDTLPQSCKLLLNFSVQGVPLHRFFHLLILQMLFIFFKHFFLQQYLSFSSSTIHQNYQVFCYPPYCTSVVNPIKYST